MATILDKLAAHALQRVEEKRQKVSLEEIRERAFSLCKYQPETSLKNRADAPIFQTRIGAAHASRASLIPSEKPPSRISPRDAALTCGMGEKFTFEKALSGEGIHFICECKKASPSKGLIAPEFPFADIARDYEAAGASAISVLTEPKWFLGEDRFLEEIAAAVRIPCLRKDFTVDPYMIYEAKLLGASAVLLICAILDDSQLEEYLETAHALGMSALVEAHDETEVRRALAAGARIIGVNNRDLRTFQVDINNSVRLRSLVPPDRIYVSESGIRNADDVGTLFRNGTNAVLIGETLMRSSDKGAKLRELKSKCI